MEKFVTVTEMCEILGVSKTRLYCLIRDGILPAPMRHPVNSRPLWNTELTEACRQVMKTRIGVNGQPYTPNQKRRGVSAVGGQRHRHESLIASLGSLGMSVTAKQVDDVVKNLPDGLEEKEVLKQAFLRLRHKR